MRLNRGLVKCIIPPRLALWVTLVYSIVFVHAHHSMPRLYMSSLPSVKSATGGGRRTAQLFIYAGPPDITIRRQREKVFLDFWRKFEPFLDQTRIPLTLMECGNMFLLVPCAAMATSSGVSQVGKRGGCVLGLCKRRTPLGSMCVFMSMSDMLACLWNVCPRHVFQC